MTDHESLLSWRPRRSVTLAFSQGMASRGVNPTAASEGFGTAVALASDQHRQAGRTNSAHGLRSRVPRQYLSETSSGRRRLLDYDGDGWLDIFIVSGTRFEGAPPGSDKNPST